MSDLAYAPIPVEAPPDDGKEKCQHCDGRYLKGPGMARHLTRSHPDQHLDTQDAQCPECGKWLTEGSVTRHRRKVHGVFSGRRRGPGRPVGSKNRNLPAATPARTVRGQVDSNHSPLTADQITTAAAISLFPSGVPTRKLQSMLRWHEATLTFLREVADE